MSDNKKQWTLDGNAIDKMIAAIGVASESIKHQISICAASTVLHAIKHSDISKCTRLIETLSAVDANGKTPWRTNALKEWYIAKGPVSLVTVTDASGKTKQELKFDASKRAKLIKIMEADELMLGGSLVRDPFWNFKPEPEFKGFDFEKELASLLSKAAKAATKTADATLPDEDRSKIKLGRYSEVLKALGTLHNDEVPFTPDF